MIVSLLEKKKKKKGKHPKKERNISPGHEDLDRNEKTNSLGQVGS